jgi:hypothetical protein
VVASLLKLYLRLLPDSPLSDKFNARFVKRSTLDFATLAVEWSLRNATAGESDEIQRFEMIRNLVTNLPPRNRNLLRCAPSPPPPPRPLTLPRYLLQFLSEVVARSSENKMNSRGESLLFSEALSVPVHVPVCTCTYACTYLYLCAYLYLHV